MGEYGQACPIDTQSQRHGCVAAALFFTGVWRAAVCLFGWPCQFGEQVGFRATRAECNASVLDGTAARIIGQIFEKQAVGALCQRNLAFRRRQVHGDQGHRCMLTDIKRDRVGRRVRRFIVDAVNLDVGDVVIAWVPLFT